MNAQLRRWLASPALLCLMALAACSSGGSDSNSNGTYGANLDGFWKIWPTVTGSTEFGPEWLHFTINGSTISAIGTTGTINGNSFDLTISDNQGTTNINGTMSSTTAGTGTFQITTSSGSFDGTFRMEKFAPVGTFSVNGTISGIDVTHSSSTAFGGKDYSDQAKTVLEDVELGSADSTLEMEIDIDATNLALGTLTVGTGAGEVRVDTEFATSSGYIAPSATGGTLTVTKYDPTGFTGSFTLNLSTGDTITGSFDVQFELESN